METRPHGTWPTKVWTLISRRGLTGVLEADGERLRQRSGRAPRRSAEVCCPAGTPSNSPAPCTHTFGCATGWQRSANVLSYCRVPTRQAPGLAPRERGSVPGSPRVSQHLLEPMSPRLRRRYRPRCHSPHRRLRLPRTTPPAPRGLSPPQHPPQQAAPSRWNEGVSLMRTRNFVLARLIRRNPIGPAAW